MGDKTVREAVGVFHDETALRDAADELMTAGFDRSDLSLLAGDHAVEQKLGHAYKKVEELEDDAEVPSVFGLENVTIPGPLTTLQLTDRFPP